MSGMFEQVAYRPFKDIPLVTALPSNPSNGDMIVFTDSLTAPTYSWMLKYVAAKSSNKWVFIGGAPVRVISTDPNAVVNTLTQIGATGYYRPTTSGTWTTPVAADWRAYIYGQLDPNGGAAGAGAVGFFTGSTVAGALALSLPVATAGIWGTQSVFIHATAVAASTTVGVCVLPAVAGTNKMRQVICDVLPLAVGG